MYSLALETHIFIKLISKGYYLVCSSFETTARGIGLLGSFLAVFDTFEIVDVKRGLITSVALDDGRILNLVASCTTGNNNVKNVGTGSLALEGAAGAFAGILAGVGSEDVLQKDVIITIEVVDNENFLTGPVTNAA